MILILYLCLLIQQCFCCHPLCYYECSNPVCPAVCEPICSAPNCQICVNNTNSSDCSPWSSHCYVNCPIDQCESDECPACEVMCPVPQCPPGKHCYVQCTELHCTWKCMKPNCPYPVCVLQCEAPSCPFSASVKNKFNLLMCIILLICITIVNWK